MESNTLFNPNTHGLPSNSGLSLSLDPSDINASQSASFASLDRQNPSDSMLPVIDDGQFGLLAKAQAKKTREKGSGGDDKFTARGNVIYKALGGDDRITVKKSNNTIVGGGGSDRINAKKGRGNNVLKGGGGQDEIIGGGRDDLLVGGGGADLLVIADGKLNKGMSIIKGFKKSDAIAILNVKKADEFEDLSFKKQGKDTLIRVGKRDIALVQKIKPNALKKRADDFVFSEDETIPPEVPIEPPIEPSIEPPNTPSLSIGDRPNLPEGDSGASEEFFVVTLNQALASTVTVDYTLTPGSATLNSDFSATTTGTLTFTPGDTSEQISVSILGDMFKEDDETFTITLSNASSTVTIADGTANGTIVDDEDALTQIQGNTYSQSAQNQETLDSQFDIYTVNQDGFFIPDETLTDSKTGTFLGTIQNFRSVEGKLKVVRDDGIDPSNDDVVTENGFAVVSDQQPLVLKDTVFDVGNLEAKLVYNAPLFGNRTVIEYTIYTGTGGDRTDIRTSVLDIDDLGDSSNPTDTFNDFPTRALPPNFDQDLAINSLSYIVDNHLLGLTVPLLDPDEDGIFEPGAVDIILQDTFEKDLATSSSQSRKGNRYSKTGQDQTVITRLFDVVNVDDADQFIQDGLATDATTGLFLGAVENLEVPTGGSITFDSDGNPIIDPNNPITDTTLIAADANLEATLTEQSITIDDRDVTQYTITYTIFTGQGASRVDQFTAILEFNGVEQFDENNGFGLFPDKSLPQPFDLEQAINSLTYIIENDLLSLTEAPNNGLSEVLALEEIEV